MIGGGGDWIEHLVVLVPLVVGGREDAVDLGLSGGGEGGVGEEEIEAGEDLVRPLRRQLRPHDLPAGPEPVQAEEPRLPPGRKIAGAPHPVAAVGLPSALSGGGVGGGVIGFRSGKEMDLSRRTAVGEMSTAQMKGHLPSFNIWGVSFD